MIQSKTLFSTEAAAVSDFTGSAMPISIYVIGENTLGVNKITLNPKFADFKDDNARGYFSTDGILAALAVGANPHDLGTAPGGADVQLKTDMLKQILGGSLLRPLSVMQPDGTFAKKIVNWSKGLDVIEEPWDTANADTTFSQRGQSNEYVFKMDSVNGKATLYFALNQGKQSSGYQVSDFLRVPLEAMASFDGQLPSWPWFSSNPAEIDKFQAIAQSQGATADQFYHYVTISSVLSVGVEHDPDPRWPLPFKLGN
jgi:hypothetical protein